MKKNIENLDNYKDAYKQNFKFHDENIWYLTLYASLMCKKIKEKNFKSVLSLGIGHNVVSDEITKLLKTDLDLYHIVEGSPEIIADFKTRNDFPKIKLHNSYFEDFNPEVKYDAIEMGFVLEHVDDPLLIIERFKNFLNKDGIMFISVPNAKSLHRLIGHRAGLLPNLYELSQYDLELGHKRYFDLDSIIALVQKAGLQIINQKGLMLKPITGEQIKKINWGINIIDALMDIGQDYPEISNCIYLESTL
jgi:2-polyprenyl-3-methyl-5-hydroxy-6-metoxy-1,4-benzoquinol methylase